MVLIPDEVRTVNLPKDSDNHRVVSVQSADGGFRIDFFWERLRLSATERFFEFRERGRLVRRIFSIAWVFATALPSRMASS